MAEQLTVEQMEYEAKELCKWAAARAGAIAVIPIAGSIALIANEVYMISRISKVHGKELSDGAILGFLGGFAGSVIGQTLTNLIPFAVVQIPVAMGVTYALGIAAHEWINAGCPSDLKAFEDIFNKAKEEATDLVPMLKKHPKKDEPLGDEKREYTVK